jgi:prepilin-type N-terminal cleavage/methylation domain-containing protein
MSRSQRGFPSVSTSSLRCGGGRRFIRPQAAPVACSRAAREAGFTLIEVMACVLVLSLGLTAACGLTLYGLHLARSAHGRTIGLATAMTVLNDPSPLQTDPSMSPNAPSSSGYLNGLWVVRTESAPAPVDGGVGKHVAVTVSVDVFEVANGENFASVTRRIIRHIP